MRELLLADLGRREYLPVWRLQKGLVEARAQGSVGDLLLLVEHQPVITIGRRGGAVEREGDREGPGLPIYWVERGGEATYHGPGQVVGYLILKLDEWGLSIKRYLEMLEEGIIEAVKGFGIRADRGPQRGVWVGGRKLASIGVAIARWITYHGFSLNVARDLEGFRLIRPCGLDPSTITSMEELLGRPISLGEVKRRLIEALSSTFQASIRKADVEVLEALVREGP